MKQKIKSSNKAICLYLHLHQPIRYREYSAFEISNHSDYFSSPNNIKQNNRVIFKKVAKKSYYPMLNLLEKKMQQHPNFKISFSITGTWLNQARKWEPSLIDQIKRMVKSGQLEILGETFYHSLAYFYDIKEFETQVDLHKKVIKQLFGVEPKVFRNTELAYNDSLANWAEKNGYKGILAEGWDKILNGRSPNHVYRPNSCKNLNLLLKNYRLSDDIAFRFSNRSWNEWPLTAEKFLNWLEKECVRGGLINLFMDFETYGEHQWCEAGIFDFIDKVISGWLSLKNHDFLTVNEACDYEKPVDEITMPETVTWADSERDLSAWLSNSMQKSASKLLYSMKERVFSTKDKQIITDWRLLTTSDHPYSMCTKYWNDGDVHAYFSAYKSPYDSFLYYINILRDLEYRIKRMEAPEGASIDS